MVKHSEFIEKLKEIYGSERIITVNTTCRGYGFNTRIPLDQVSASLCFVTNFDDDGNVFIQDNDLFEDLYEWYGDEFEEKYNEVLSRLKLLAEKYNVEFDEKTNTFKIKILSIEQDTVKDYVSRFTNFLVSAVNVLEYLKECTVVYSSVTTQNSELINEVKEMISIEELYRRIVSVYHRNLVGLDLENNEIEFVSEYFDELGKNYRFKIISEGNVYKVVEDCSLYDKLSILDLDKLNENDIKYNAMFVLANKKDMTRFWTFDNISLKSKVNSFIKDNIVLNNLDCFIN